MRKLIECVPNFSEGRNKQVIDDIIMVIKSVPDVHLLDYEMDASHNRSVITFIGAPESVASAAFKATAQAMSLIDLNKHQGEHPRMGATDVIPFIPLNNATMDDCIQLAKAVGREIGDKLQIPVFLYEFAATRPDRRNLADVRRGEFEGLRSEIGANLDRTPDFGPNRIHPTAGATAVGARMILIAYNVNLDTDNIKIAKEIAKKIRESSGGLPNVKALGLSLQLKDKTIAQISMNLTNYKVTPIKKVLDVIKEEAQAHGVGILESELIGLAPQDAFESASPADLLIKNFSPKQIIENRL